MSQKMCPLLAAAAISSSPVCDDEEELKRYLDRVFRCVGDDC